MNFGDTVVWSSLAHPLGNTQKVPYRRRCLTGDPFIHCNLAKWEQSRGVLQLSGALQRGCATGALPLYYTTHSGGLGHFAEGVLPHFALEDDQRVGKGVG